MSKLRGAKRHCLFRAMDSQMSMGRGLVLHRGVWGSVPCILACMFGNV